MNRNLMAQYEDARTRLSEDLHYLKDSRAADLTQKLVIQVRDGKIANVVGCDGFSWVKLHLENCTDRSEAAEFWIEKIKSYMQDELISVTEKYNSIMGPNGKHEFAPRVHSHDGVLALLYMPRPTSPKYLKLINAVKRDFADTPVLLEMVQDFNFDLGPTFVDTNVPVAPDWDKNFWRDV